MLFPEDINVTKPSKISFNSLSFFFHNMSYSRDHRLLLFIKWRPNQSNRNSIQPEWIVRKRVADGLHKKQTTKKSSSHLRGGCDQSWYLRFFGGKWPKVLLSNKKLSFKLPLLVHLLFLLFPVHVTETSPTKISSNEFWFILPKMFCSGEQRLTSWQKMKTTPIKQRLPWLWKNC